MNNFRDWLWEELERKVRNEFSDKTNRQMNYLDFPEDRLYDMISGARDELTIEDLIDYISEYLEVKDAEE